MDQGTSSNKTALTRDIATFTCADQNTCEDAQETKGKVAGLGKAFIKTVKHFWPQMNIWLETLPDTRFKPFVIYNRKFLSWWGLCLFTFKLSSRRQLDFDMRDLDSSILSNINRLAQTSQKTLPVNGTLDHFFSHSSLESISHVRTKMIRRLIRMKAIEDCRLQKSFVVAVDGTGYLVFGKEHCKNCLTQKHASGAMTYSHPVLEAKIVSSSGLALSVGTEFIDNSIVSSIENENQKQDCESKAFARLALQLKKDFPQTPLCIIGDALYACGSIIQVCKDQKWDFVFTFKEGRSPALWTEFHSLLHLCPQNTMTIKTPDGAQQLYRWVNDLSYQDSDKRNHTFDAIMCTETIQNKTTTFTWITSFHVTKENIIDISTKGGRNRWKIENEGFNIQKNSGLNLEHAYSTNPERLKIYYVLLQIGCIIIQLLEKGSLIKKLAGDFGKTPVQLFGSLKNLARRLLESFRYVKFQDAVFDSSNDNRIQIRLDTS